MLKILKICQSKHRSVKEKFDIITQSFCFPKISATYDRKTIIWRDLAENRVFSSGLPAVIRGALFDIENTIYSRFIDFYGRCGIENK